MTHRQVEVDGRTYTLVPQEVRTSLTDGPSMLWGFQVHVLDEEEQLVGVKTCFVGRVSVEKGVHVLLDVMAREPGLELDLIGPIDPAQQAYFAPRIGKNVRHVGHLRRSEVLERLPGYDAFVMPVKAGGATLYRSLREDHRVQLHPEPGEPRGAPSEKPRALGCPSVGQGVLEGAR